MSKALLCSLFALLGAGTVLATGPAKPKVTSDNGQKILIHTIEPDSAALRRVRLILRMEGYNRQVLVPTAHAYVAGPKVSPAFGGTMFYITAKVSGNTLSLSAKHVSYVGDKVVDVTADEATKAAGQPTPTALELRRVAALYTGSPLVAQRR
ncbi:hypothetical protein LRS06_02330 [Hymenobacter sp. J193]|uniref:hypothetical protein n=1 Tax=Hymenobacter sp. J193 TaxID=2898429 RepID=UPI002150724A|nr:hypothetical protein [Hymenobacter sp. J193]MCR5886629.1 hypothetical protein [Hymenobacter sp. J193]